MNKVQEEVKLEGWQEEIVDTAVFWMEKAGLSTETASIIAAKLCINVGGIIKEEIEKAKE